MIQKLKGFQDKIGIENDLSNRIINECKTLFEIFDYKYLETPILESTELFNKSIGDSTDIIQHEMFSFIDINGKNVSLRPELTTPVIRYYNNKKIKSIEKYYSIGPVFRRENPQLGRFRQFNQINCEILGLKEEDSLFYKIELLCLLELIFNKLNLLSNIILEINYIGCQECRNRYKLSLENWIKKENIKLCNNCNNRLDKNPLRILDCKNEYCIEELITKSVPIIRNFLCNKCEKDFNDIQELLNYNEIEYILNYKLFRGLDYYNGLVFEVKDRMNNSNTLSAGGEYNNLINQLGGNENVSGIGFGIGLERVYNLFKLNSKDTYNKNLIYIVTLNDEAKKYGFKISLLLKQFNIKSKCNIEDKSLKAQLREANKLNYNYCLIIGKDEIYKGCVIFKDMINSKEKLINVKPVLTSVIVNNILANINSVENLGEPFSTILHKNLYNMYQE